MHANFANICRYIVFKKMSRVLAGDLGWGGWKDQTADTGHSPQDSGEGEEAGEGKREDEGGGADGHAARGQADPQAGGLNSSVQTVPLR